jgi:hypothetical protein
MKGGLLKAEKNKSNAETILNRVQHKVQKCDRMVRFWSFCHPEPGPELNSGSIDFEISVLGFGV